MSGEPSAKRLRFLGDEDFNAHLVRGVRRRNGAVDIVTVSELGLKGTGDDAVLEYADRSGRTLLTHDKRTMPWHLSRRIEAGSHSPGVIILSKSLSRADAIESILLIWQESSPEEWLDLYYMWR